MTALARFRKTPMRGKPLNDSPYALGVKASTKIYGGSIVVNDAGVLAPGRTATGLIALGVADETYDNSSGAASAITGQAIGGTFRFGNSALTDLIAITDVGSSCYIVDDQTVAKTSASSTRSIAGKIIDVDSDGVWVQIGPGT